jgi:septum formation protein
MRLILASGSPRRAAILDQVGLNYEVEVPGVDETRFPDEEPVKYVERIARDKALAVLVADAVVVAGDTAVVSEGRVLGKPGHPSEARSMLARLQGATHEVLTAVAVAAHVDGEVVVHALVDQAVVEMSPMTEEEIDSYVATGEPIDKAGAYALQGRGGRFVDVIHGHPATVVGLPVQLLGRLFNALGIDESSLFRTGEAM